MSPETHQRVRRLFDEALERPEDERPRFLEAQCPQEPAILQAVQRLLAAHRESSGFLAGSQTSRRLGRYVITREIGRGGMGIVYAAVDPVIGRNVAVKVIRIDSLADSGNAGFLRERLIHEARSSGTLLHPGIVLIFDVGQDGDLAFIAMELVEGQSLDERISSGAQLQTAETLDVLRQAAAALDYAHQNGIVHRDIKPANIMLNPSRQVKIADFGIAKITTSLHQTASGMVFGTPTYMSPEQIEMGKLDGRSDQFSLAVVAYELLTGAKPFRAESLAALAHQIVYQDCPSARAANPTLPEAADQVLRKAMAKLPDGRYPTCTEFVAALEQAIPQVSAPAPSPPAMPTAVAAAPPLAATPKPKSPAIRYGVAAAAILLVGAFAVYRLAPHRAETHLPTPAPAPAVLPAVPEVVRFIASTDSIPAGGSAVLRWEVKDATEVRIEPGIGKVASSDQAEVKPTEDTTYLLTAKSSRGETSAKAIIGVEKPVAPDAALRGKRLFAEAQVQRQALKQKSLDLLRQSADLGYPPAMVELGEDAMEGDTSEKERALQWFRKAAATGSSAAMLNLGAMYYLGNGVPEDNELAAYWYRKAADAGNSAAMYNLGRMYETGHGLPVDHSKALALYRSAAALSNTSARRRLIQLGAPEK